MNLEKIVGTWESVNLHPTIIITHNHKNRYDLIIVYIDEDRKQACPSSYEIEVEEENCFIRQRSKQFGVVYDERMDLLEISNYGNYRRV